MTTLPRSIGGSAPKRLLRSVRLPFGLSPTIVALSAIVMLAAGLRLVNIDAIGQANTYYTAAVKGMLESWHNFFFAAAEPGGSVSVDKPPLGLWLQAISAYFLGVSGFAVVLPQILAGIFSVILLFHLVRRSFGNPAGLLAAFVLAVTPVAIAVERNNTPDGTLIFTLLLAAWAFIKATETRKLRFLLLGAVLVGLGFNIKMMQAFLPLPAFYALYFFGSQQGWWRKIGHLALTTMALLAVSLSWAVIVDLTPADQRPYVGSSTTNSELELIVGYNGLQRLLGRSNGPGNTASRPTNAQAVPDGAGQDGQGLPGGRAQPGFGGNGGPGGSGGMFNTGQPGVFRLFQSGLAAQVSWLLPFGLLMLIAMAASMAWWRPQTDLHRGVILWGGWLLTCVVFFSIAGFFHQYYLAMLGAPLAASVALGMSFLWRLRSIHPFRAAFLLLLAAGVTLSVQVYLVRLYTTNTAWLGLPLVLGVIGLAMLLVSVRRTWLSLQRSGFALATVALLVVPTVWSGLTTAYANTSGPLPQAYGETRGGFATGGRNFQDGGRGTPPGQQTGQIPDGAPVDGGNTPGGFGGEVNQTMLNYLQAHTQDTKYMLVVPSSQAGAGYVLATGRPVFYAGGFSGSDPVIDGAGLAKLVAAGEARYVLWGAGGGRGGNASITSYLESSCSVVDAAEIGTTSGSTALQADGAPGGLSGRDEQSTLYDCGS